MKFLCSNCKAKYQIPDEKIAGRTLKMDCRRCGTPITVRGDQPQPDDVDDAALEPAESSRPKQGAPASATASARARAPGSSSSTSNPRVGGASTGGSSVGPHPAGGRAAAPQRSALGADFRRNVGAGAMAPSEPARATPLDQWHVAINDVPVGPMKREEIARKIATGAVTGESLAWREGFDDWRPLREIAELAALLRRTVHESQPPAARPGAPRAPAPGVRPGAAPRAAAPAPTRPGAPAARPGVAARSNVVPIGGRLGASAAPSLDLEDGEGENEEVRDAEATTVASAADLGLADFGRSVRDDGAIPGPVTTKDRAEPGAKADDKKGFKPIPPPGARPVGAPAKPAPAPAAKAPPAKPPTDEPDTLIGAPLVAEPAAPKRGSFAPPPPAAAPLAPPPAAVAAPIAAPLAAPPAAAPLAPAAPPAAAPFAAAPAAHPVAQPQPAQPQRGLGVGALMGIGFAMAAGAVLMYGVVQRFVLAPAAAPATVAVATVQPAPSAAPAQHEATVDVSPTPPPSAPPPSEAEATPPPSSTVAAAPEEHHHTGTGTGTTSPTPPPSSGARAATKTSAATDSRFAAFSDEGSGGGPARIDIGSEGLHSEASSAHATARTELTAEQITEVRRAGQRGLTQCWETALRAAGRVDSDVRYDIDITIGGSGRVTVVHARGPVVGGLADCLERSVRRWQFPPSSGETQTTFPIVFSAQH